MSIISNVCVCVFVVSSEAGAAAERVSGSAVAGASALLHAGVCSGGAHHQHPSERAAATGAQELASPQTRHRGWDHRCLRSSVVNTDVALWTLHLMVNFLKSVSTWFPSKCLAFFRSFSKRRVWKLFQIRFIEFQPICFPSMDALLMNAKTI